MNLYDEIARMAWELYEKSGYIPGRDFENWLEAEKIVLSRHASQEMEEPEEDEVGEAEEPPSVHGEGIIGQAGATGDTGGYVQRTEGSEETTVIEELEVRETADAETERAERPKAKQAKKRPPAKKAASKGEKGTPEKKGKKSSPGRKHTKS